MDLIYRNQQNIIAPFSGVWPIDFGFTPPIQPTIFDYYKRTDLNVLDLNEGSDSVIQGGYEAVFDGASSFYIGETNLGTSHTITFINNAIDTVNQQIILGQSTLSACYLLKGSTNHRYRVNGVDTFINYGIKAGDVMQWVRDGAELKVYANGNLVDTRDLGINGDKDFVIDTVGSRLGNLFLDASVNYLNLDDKRIFYFNNHLYDSVTGQEATNSGITFTPDNSNSLVSVTNALNCGYYILSGGEKVINPQFELPVGAESISGGKVHNLIDSYWLFPTGVMDRSDVTTFNAACRASIYYDLAQPTLWHISEIDYDTIQSYIEALYTETVFTGFKTNYGDKLNVFRLFGYSTQLTSDDLVSTLLYINYLLPYELSDGSDYQTTSGKYYVKYE